MSTGRSCGSPEAAAVDRPIIFPLSNPASHAEARPDMLSEWTDGRAIIGTGSPFPPVKGALTPVTQVNNVYIFPGVALGALAAGARGVSDAMFMASARALAEAADGSDALLPPVTALREVALTVATAVAEQAVADGLAMDEVALEL